MLNSLGRAAADSDATLGRQQPRVQVGQGRYGVLLTQCGPLLRHHARRLLLDGVQLPNAPQRLLGHRAAAGGMHVDELAPDVGQASELGGASGK